MKRGSIFIWDLIIRYSLLIIAGIFSLQIFYFIFSPLTIYPVFFFLKFFFNASLTSNLILVNNMPIQLIGPCIAGSAYYLLLILNLSIPKIRLGKRIGLLFFSFFCLLAVNILRIIILSFMFISGTSFFDLTHKLFWYAGSTIFVVAIWFFSIYLFKIREIPFYSDIASLLKKKKSQPKKVRKRKH
jgi:hypothetical protein